MQTADFNHNDFQTGQESRLDEALFVKFFLKERKDSARTVEEGRPIFKEVEYIEIRVPGKRDPQACRPATLADKNRFPRHYEAFQKRTELPVEGTPLSEWPQISRSQAEELAFLSVKTVEQLVAMSDTNVTQLQGGYTLKRRAVEWLEAASASKLIAEKEALQDRLNEQDGEIAAMKAQMAELLAGKTTAPVVDQPEAIDDQAEAPAPKRRSRTRKAKE